MEYVTVRTYKNFENGIKQIEFEMPVGLHWAYDKVADEYWTIVPKEFYKSMKLSSEINHQNLFDKWEVLIIRSIDPAWYFDEYSVTSEEIMDSIALDKRIFAFIKDSTELGALVRFGKMTSFRGPATYIQLLSHGIVNEPYYGLYNVPDARPSQLDTFGHGKWVEVCSDRANKLWTDLYLWVLDKLAFIDRPCPVMLNCNAAADVWKDSFQGPFSKTKYDIDYLDKTMMSTIIDQIRIFAGQFVNTGIIKKLQDELVNPDYENDYIDIDE